MDSNYNIPVVKTFYDFSDDIEHLINNFFKQNRILESQIREMCYQVTIDPDGMRLAHVLIRYVVEGQDYK